MINIILTWITIAILGITLAAPLGPVNVEMIKQALNKSMNNYKLAWLAAILTGIGATSGDLIISTIALTVGGEILIDIFSFPLLKLCLFLINIVILGYLGFSALIKSSETHINFHKDSENTNILSTKRINKYFYLKRYATGLSLVLSSPWSYLWWVSAGTIILFSDFNVPDFFSRMAIVFMFLSGILLWVISFCSLLAFIGKSPNPRYFIWVTRGTAIILLLFAGIIAKSAFDILLELLNII